MNEEDIARLSPARYEHINPYGKYRFEVEEGLSRSTRPAKPPPELVGTRPILSAPVSLEGLPDSVSGDYRRACNESSHQRNAP